MIVLIGVVAASGRFRMSRVVSEGTGLGLNITQLKYFGNIFTHHSINIIMNVLSSKKFEHSYISQLFDNNDSHHISDLKEPKR